MQCCAKPKKTLTSPKQWDQRPVISPKLIVLHSTESTNAENTAAYLARKEVQADVHVLISQEGDEYRLVPNLRKAWHVGSHNGFSLGIEMVGRAAQTHWPDSQVRAVARRIACWSHQYNIPIKSRGIVTGRWGGRPGVVYHRTISGPGGHWDPGYHFPIWRCLRLARKYKKACYGA